MRYIGHVMENFKFTNSTKNIGPPGGLELILDAQQYEYMYYPAKENYAAGKVILK